MADHAEAVRKPRPAPHAAQGAAGGHAINHSGPVQMLGETAAGLNARPAVAAQRALAGRLSNAAPNRTGLPARLKTGLESLSGISMDDVRVHRNSSAPAQLNAHAYAQGSDIHLAPGQDHHLPHEAWHVVQQKQGRVKARMQLKAGQLKGTPINDDPALEHEADHMGARAMHATPARRELAPSPSHAGPAVQRRIKIKGGQLWSSKSQLPRDVPRGRLRGMLSSGLPYLALSLNAVRERANGRAAPILTPYRHLIGENHDDSHFREAVNTWGWGADKMMESFQHSTDVPDRLAEARAAPGVIYNNWQTGMKPLENFHPYMLTGFGMLKVRLDLLRTATTQLQNSATAIALGGGNRVQFNQRQGVFDGLSGGLSESWDGIAVHLPSYEHAIAAAHPPLAMFAFMAGNWQNMRNAYTPLTKRPYSAWNGWIATATALGNRAAAITAFIANYVTPWSQALIQLTEQEATAVLGRRPPRSMRQAGLTAKWNQMDHNHGNMPIDHFSPIRELFMAHSINTTLHTPGLVGIGAAHVNRVAAQVHSARPHASYDAFVADISAP